MPYVTFNAHQMGTIITLNPEHYLDFTILFDKLLVGDLIMS